MAKQTTFKVSRTGVEPVTVNFLEPENITDPRWAELGITSDNINELAVQNLVIKIQGIARGKLDDGAAAVQGAVDGYKYGQRAAGGTRKVSLAPEQVKTLAFTDEQLAALRAAGVSIPGMDAAEATPTEDAKPAASGKGK